MPRALCLTPRLVRASLCAALLAAASVAAPAHAVVSLLTIQYFAGYRQNSPAAPTVEVGCDVYWNLHVTDAADLTSVSLTRPGEDEPFDFLGTSGPGTEYSRVIGNFMTKVDAFSVIPAGDYTVAISGGTLGDQTATVTQPHESGNWPESIPAFTPATWTALQGMDPTNAITIEFNPMLPGPNTPNFVLGSVSVFDITAGVSRYQSAIFLEGASSVVIPASTLLPAHQHRIFLTFNSGESAATTAFGTVTPQIYFGYQTFADFTTGDGTPVCPADFNGDGDVNPDDLGDFINCFFSAPPCELADFNADGDVNPDDLGDYINVFFGAPCP